MTGDQYHGPTGPVTMAWGRFAYRRAGAGRPLVVLHSLALSGAMWEPLWDELAGRFDVIAPDLRGHGASTWDGTPFTVEDLADDIAGLLDELSLASCCVMGLSMGGSVATVLAARHAERVERLALCDTTAWYGEDAPVRWEQRAQQAESTPREKQVAFQVDRWFSEQTRRTEPDVVAHAVRLFLRTAPRVHGAACRALGALDARSKLGSITASTLVVAGEQDYATPPPMGRDLAAGIAGATFEEWPGLRHMAVLESAGLRAHLLDHVSADGASSVGTDGVQR